MSHWELLRLVINPGFSLPWPEMLRSAPAFTYTHIGEAVLRMENNGWTELFGSSKVGNHARMEPDLNKILQLTVEDDEILPFSLE